MAQFPASEILLQRAYDRIIQNELEDARLAGHGKPPKHYPPTHQSQEQEVKKQFAAWSNAFLL